VTAPLPTQTARRVSGILAPVTTPFDPTTGELALDRAVENAERLLAQGLDGLVVAGSTGEAPLLDPDEQRRLVAALRVVVPADRWLLAGAGAESTRSSIALARAAATEGADAVLVRPPGYYSTALSANSLVTHYRAIADASPVPVLVYNIPKYTHLAIAPDLLSRLAGHDNIVGVKDSSGDPKNLVAYRRLVPTWTVLVGSGSLLATAYAAACNGGIVGVSCFAAPQAVALAGAFRSGESAQVAALQSRLEALHKDIVARLGPAGIKAAMDVIGLYGGPVRAPLAPLAAADRERVERLLAS
jgi:dihydrodipicolinate synthase/N-acetylneuraminate lyase